MSVGGLWPAAQASPAYYPAIEAKQLAEMDAKPRVPLKPEFAIAPHVLAAAADWPVVIDDAAPVHYYRCGRCEQAIAPAGTTEPLPSWDDHHRAGLPGTYQYDGGQLHGQVLAHLMQRHGWTRENTGG